MSNCVESTPPRSALTSACSSPFGDKDSGGNGGEGRRRRDGLGLRFRFPPDDHPCTSRTTSLDEPAASSPGAQEAKRKSLAAVGRSKSLGYEGHRQQQQQRHRQQQQQQQQQAQTGSRRVETDSVERCRHQPPERLSGVTVRSGDDSSGGGILSALKTRYSQRVVGYGSENCSWSFLLSLPHLIMVSNLQSFLGVSGTGAGVAGSVARGKQRPSIQPNEYMDGVIANMKADMKERGLNELALPDQQMVVNLYNGQVTGLTNLSRRGDALLEAEKDHFLLSFALQARDVRCAYWWRKQRLKGEVAAIVQRIIMNMKIRQMVSGSNPPELIDFQVQEVAGVQVHLVGLGPLNWVVRRTLKAFLRRHLSSYLEKEGRELIAQELQQAAQEQQQQQNQSTVGEIASFLGF